MPSDCWCKTLPVPFTAWQSVLLQSYCNVVKARSKRCSYQNSQLLHSEVAQRKWMDGECAISMPQASAPQFSQNNGKQYHHQRNFISQGVAVTQLMRWCSHGIATVKNGFVCFPVRCFFLPAQQKWQQLHTTKMWNVFRMLLFSTLRNPPESMDRGKKADRHCTVLHPV